MQLEGSQFPERESNWCPLQWTHGVLTTGLPGKYLSRELWLGDGRPRHWSEIGHFLTMSLFSGKLDVFLFKTGRLGDDFKLSSTKKLLAAPLGDHYKSQ